MKITAIISDLNSDNAEDLLAKHDAILDGTDNFETRLILNDISVKYGIPWIYGAATGSYGLSYTFLPDETACFSCLYRLMPIGGETCETVGIIGPAAELTASIQCTEAIKILTNNKENLRKGLFYFDLWSNDFSTIGLKGIKDTECPTCGLQLFPHLQKGSGTKTAVLCGRNTVQIRPPFDVVFDYKGTIKQLKNSGLDISSNDFLTQLSIGSHRLVLFHDGRALVHGTNSVEDAKKLYQRFFGG